MMILGEEAAYLHDIFIETFVNIDCEYYRENIQKKQQFSDGEFSVGYLWDCMVQRKVVSMNFVTDFLQRLSSEVYILWDAHSCDLIWIENYWKYPKDAVLCVPADLIPGLLPTLTDDCYFFDKTLTWAIALTHEESKPGRRFCLFTDLNQRISK